MHWPRRHPWHRHPARHGSLPVSAPRCFPACAGSCCSPPLRWPVQAALPGPVQQAPGVSVCRVGIAVSCCAETVSVTAAVFSSGCAASASGAPIEKVIANARTAAAHRVLPRCRGQSVYSRTFFSCCAPNLMHFYRDAALRKKGSVSSSQYSFSIHPRASPRQLPHTAKRSSEKAAAPVSENAPKQIRLSPQKHCTKPKIADISSKISILSCCLDMCMVLYLTCSFCIESTILKQKGSFSSNVKDFLKRKDIVITPAALSHWKRWVPWRRACLPAC